MKNDIKPWHRQTEETSEQFDLFSLYLRERVVTEVAKIYFAGRDENGVNAGRVYANHLKTTKKWNARCAAYDRWVAKQKDDASAELIAQEMALIKKQRVTLLHKIYQKVNKAVDSVKLESITSKELYQVQTLVGITEKMLNMWEKFEQSNPALATVSKPFENEIAGMQEKLLIAIGEKQKKLVSNEPNPEILQ